MREQRINLALTIAHINRYWHWGVVGVFGSAAANPPLMYSNAILKQIRMKHTLLKEQRVSKIKASSTAKVSNNRRYLFWRKLRRGLCQVFQV